MDGDDDDDLWYGAGYRCLAAAKSRWRATAAAVTTSSPRAPHLLFCLFPSVQDDTVFPGKSGKAGPIETASG
ncbi:hypothetical protein ON010_g6600 [Phytophthora cinnamomi]|nr:hypothetical protein ON010_g6600 [Phytophthora cinnamomi]